MLVAGALFSISWFLLIDAWVLMNREPDPKNHASFMYVIPSFITTFGFLVINLTSPEDVVSAGLEGSVSMGGGDGIECSKPFAFLFIGWFICIGSTIMSLVVVGLNFLGDDSTRTIAFPAFALVAHSCVLPCVASMMWFARGKGTFGEEEEDDW